MLLDLAVFFTKPAGHPFGRQHETAARLADTDAESTDAGPATGLRAAANAATLHLLPGQTKYARDLLAGACGVDPQDPARWRSLGDALQHLGQHGLARNAFINSQALGSLCLGSILDGVNASVCSGDEAIELLRLQAMAVVDPLSPIIHIGIGALLEKMGNRADAIDALERALAIDPDAVVPLQMLVPLLMRSNKLSQAEQIYARLILLEPENPRYVNDRAAVLMKMHRHAEARDLLLDLVGSDKSNTAVRCNLANATVCVGLQDEAVDMAYQALAADPGSLLAQRTICSTIAYRDGTSGAAMLAAMQSCSAVIPRDASVEFSNLRDPLRPLVIGLLSGSLRSHPVGWLTIAGIENLPRERFQIICLAQNAAPSDPIAQRYRAVAERWIDIDDMNDRQLLDVARSHGIDILIELGGYGDAGRMSACANRLAPVQIKWVGMQTHSTGLPEMDWFMTDRWETPEGFESFYSENLLTLPDGYVCYSPPQYAPDVAELPALQNGVVTFGCFNNMAKITPKTLQAWAEILRRVPRSRLVLSTHQLSSSGLANQVKADFAALGVAPERIRLEGSVGHRALLGRYNEIDIVLDPLSYSGGLTTCEALWMGVPTITLSGETFASRHSTSHMCNVGLSDWAVGSLADYIELAVAKAADIDALASLRAGLRRQTWRSPLCDAVRFGRGLEQALRRAWSSWCEKSLDGRSNNAVATAGALSAVPAQSSRIAEMCDA